MKFHRYFIALGLSLFGSAQISRASTQNLTPVDQGFYNNGTTMTPQNYASGWFVGGTSEELRDFFSFDLSPVSGTITSATLVLSMPASGYASSDPFETFTLFDVSTSVLTLNAHTPSAAIFADLGAGTVYGSINIPSSSPNTNVQIPLNAAGIAFLNSHHGTIALGGAVTSSTNGPVSEAVFNASGSFGTQQLSLEVTPAPEPTSGILLASAGLALLRRRRAAR